MTHPRLIPAVTAAIGLGLMLSAPAEVAPEAEVAETPPLAARDFAQFEFLLSRSPFSLPTAEEKSPMGDRYAITGAASWDGQQRVFVIDKTSQERIVISNEPNRLNMSLLEFLPDGDPRRMRARVKIGSEVATLEFSETAAGGPTVATMPAPTGIPGQPTAQPGAAVPQISSTGQPGTQPTRRIIRRRVITGAPPPAQ